MITLAKRNIDISKSKFIPIRLEMIQRVWRQKLLFPDHHRFRPLSKLYKIRIHFFCPPNTCKHQQSKPNRKYQRSQDCPESRFFNGIFIVGKTADKGGGIRDYAVDYP